jgi:hypothetical protein
MLESKDHWQNIDSSGALDLMFAYECTVCRVAKVKSAPPGASLAHQCARGHAGIGMIGSLTCQEDQPTSHGAEAGTALPLVQAALTRGALAQAVKAPEVTKTFETAGSPVAYLDAPEFQKFAAGDSAADRGSEEDRLGEKGNPTHILLSANNLPAPH